eukprot:TRINITY_DN13603_c0_g1_i1.p1 TRINITY_DN13603_c0_g1~~TRINITY_DN13603_c0_g1_i1.p1  ORF type:complete len:118 (-),score=3.53 TRINITY_DN13603_c0_g1_i1:33-386(-)
MTAAVSQQQSKDFEILTKIVQCCNFNTYRPESIPEHVQEFMTDLVIAPPFTPKKIVDIFHSIGIQGVRREILGRHSLKQQDKKMCHRERYRKVTNKPCGMSLVTTISSNFVLNTCVC